jgi:hypothetical protein
MDLLAGLCNNSSMSKKILLELTESEVEMIQSGIQKERSSWLEKNITEVSETLMGNNVRHCDSVLNKIGEASKPQKDVLIGSNDLFLIISNAKNEYGKIRGDLRISNKSVEEKYFIHIALANSMIMWLNGKNLLKRLAKFDYTDHSYEFEETEE